MHLPRMALALALALLAPVTVATANDGLAGDYIVVTRPTAELVAAIGAAALGRAAQTAAERAGVSPRLVFGNAFSGFAARLSQVQRARLASDPAVVAIEPDDPVSVLDGGPAGEVPSAQDVTAAPGATKILSQSPQVWLRRVGGDVLSPAATDGVAERTDVDIAVIDSGINHLSDLNIVGGYNCTGSDRSATADGNGHGTAVAGILAAEDDASGIVGLAPGARLWSIKVFYDSGVGSYSTVLCGIDWAMRRDPYDATRPLFEVANLSLTVNSGEKTPLDDHNCGKTNGDLLHQAICRLTSGGTIAVAAAGNGTRDATRIRPAAFDEVITVSALADFDGLPGGLASPRSCGPDRTRNHDDTFASFSNYGSVVDLMAPGKCVRSYYHTMSLHSWSGTSFATPMVAGAIATLRARYPALSESTIRQILGTAGSYDWQTATDPDHVADRLLSLSNLQLPPTFRIGAPAEIQVRPAHTYNVPVTLDKLNGYTGAATLVKSGTTPGISVSFTNGLLTISTPGTLGVSPYPIIMRATDGAQSVSRTVLVIPDTTPPTVSFSSLSLAGPVALSSSSANVRVAVSASEDGSPDGLRIVLQRSVNGGRWARLSLGPDNSALFPVSSSGTVRFRVRATDEAGNVSYWQRSPALRLSVVDSATGSLGYAGSWSAIVDPPSVGGSVAVTHDPAGSVSGSFTGRAAALVTRAGPDHGSSLVSFDGGEATTFTSYSASLARLQIVAGSSWSSSGVHSFTLGPSLTDPEPLPATEIDALFVLYDVAP